MGQSGFSFLFNLCFPESKGILSLISFKTKHTVFKITKTLSLLSVLAGVLLYSPEARAEVNQELLADKISQSLKSIKNSQYKTVAFSRVRNAGGRLDIDQLIDYTNVKIVRSRHLKVIDRSKLQLILREQQIQLSDFVSASKYKELGKLMGVDLFIYGTIYRDALVLKAIDVQNSSIVWAEIFPLTRNAPEAKLLWELGSSLINSLRKDLERLKKGKINQLSFWALDTGDLFHPRAVMDYLSVAVTKDGNFQVVDRENLNLIAEEQHLNQKAFIDEGNAKKLGELYGVDAFIYGKITRKRNGKIIASLKMLNIFNGVIEWGDLIKLDPSKGNGISGAKRGGVKRLSPSGMGHIPAGPFLLGNNGDPPISSPQLTKKLGAFYLDVSEVTNQNYYQFIRAKNYRAPKGWKMNNTYPSGTEDLPVVGVSWEDSSRYCNYKKKRLPTEEEWEKAARGTRGQKYPWGSRFSREKSVTKESGKKNPAPRNLNTKDVSPYGIRHMGGNVREWVDSWLTPYKSSLMSLPGIKNLFKENKRVIRGGSWATNSEYSQTFFRSSSEPEKKWADVGFRCARSK